MINMFLNNIKTFVFTKKAYSAKAACGNVWNIKTKAMHKKHTQIQFGPIIFHLFSLSSIVFHRELRMKVNQVKSSSILWTLKDLMGCWSSTWMPGNMVLMSRLDLRSDGLYTQSQRTFVIIDIIQAKCFLHESLAARY